MDDIRAIHTLVDEWSKAVREGDMEKILAHHADTFVMFDVPPPFKSVGLEAYEKTWERFFSWATEPRVFAITDLQIEASDSVAFCFGTGHCQGRSPEGKVEQLAFRLTMGLRKVEGAWTILHEHHSLPAE